MESDLYNQPPSSKNDGGIKMILKVACQLTAANTESSILKCHYLNTKKEPGSFQIESVEPSSRLQYRFY